MLKRFFLVNAAVDTKPVRVNIRTMVNSASIRQERRKGRDVLVVPSATLPDGVVMNGVRYTAEEIEKSYLGLNRKPAPLGHPDVEGAFVSASDPEGLARGWIGAWNENARRENGRVFIDKVIDLATAKELTGGKAVLAAIEAGQPIHTSTGLYCSLEKAEANAADGAEYIARDIVFDHDAILIGENGAATPEQGVGMLVNSAIGRDGSKVEVINSVLKEDAERGLGWALEDVLRSLERLDRVSKIEQMKAALLDAIKGVFGRETSTNEKESTVEKAQFDALSAEVSGLTKAQADLPKLISDAVAAAIQPVANAVTALQNAEKAKEETELSDLRAKIVNAGVMPEEVAKELTLNAARSLAGKLTETQTGDGKVVAFSLNAATAKPTSAAGRFTPPKAEG